MKQGQEKSCGAVLYAYDNDTLKFLIVRGCSGHVSFPKGHVDGDESERETAKREIAEETGVTVSRFEEGFRELFDYVTKEGNRKQVIYFLAEIPFAPVSPADGELSDCWLLTEEEALSRINTPDEQDILRRASAFIGCGIRSAHGNGES